MCGRRGQRNRELYSRSEVALFHMHAGIRPKTQLKPARYVRQPDTGPCLLVRAACDIGPGPESSTLIVKLPSVESRSASTSPRLSASTSRA